MLSKVDYIAVLKGKAADIRNYNELKIIKEKAD